MPEIVVSVVVMAYNAAGTIEQALRSVCEQRTSFDFEILVWDDASSDSTPRLVHELLTGQERSWKLFASSTNVFSTGRYPLLTMLGEISGRYVARLDGDDYWCDPEKIQNQVDLLESHPRSVLSCTAFRFVDADGATISSAEMPGSAPLVPYSRLLNGNFIVHSSAVYRTSILHNLPRSWEDLVTRDYALWGYAAVGTDIAVHPVESTAYRLHPGSAWSSQPAEYRLTRELDALDWLSRQLRDPIIADAWRLRRMQVENYAREQGLLTDGNRDDPASVAADRRVLLARVGELERERDAAVALAENRRVVLARVGELEQELASVGVDATAARSELTVASEHLAAMHGSTSWRLTAPLRHARRLLMGRR